MPIIGAFVFPHGAITLDPETRDLTKEPAYLPTTKENCIKLHSAMKSQSETLISLKPDLIILATPHGLRVQNSFLFYGNDKAFGNAGWDGKWEEFTADARVEGTTTSKIIVETLRTEGNSVELLQLGDPTQDPLPLRWAEVISFWFITEAAKATLLPLPPAIIFGIPAKRMDGVQKMIPELLKLGGDLWTFINKNLADKQVAIVISCDLSHYHSKDPTSPYEFNEDAVPFDNFCVDWSKIDISKNEVDPGGQSNQRLLKDAGNLVDHIGSCGYPGLVFLQGILTKSAQDRDLLFKANYLEYSWPTYYGMLVAHFLPDK